MLSQKGPIHSELVNYILLSIVKFGSEILLSSYCSRISVTYIYPTLSATSRNETTTPYISEEALLSVVAA
jgi:hypothetical protein